MKFQDLAQIVKHLEKNVKCPNCESGYTSEQLNIVATSPEEVLFYTDCSKCETQVLINVTLAQNRENKEILPSELQIETQLAPSISRDDFLDMKNFLNEFNGDFKNLFSQKSK